MRLFSLVQTQNFASVLTFTLLYFGLPNIQAQERCKDFLSNIERRNHHQEQLINFRSNPLTKDYDLKYHRLEWQIDPSKHYIKGKVTSHFVPTASDFQQINFDFSANMVVNEILYHGNPVNFTLTDDDILQIDLPNTLTEGQLDSITVDYEGVPSKQGVTTFFTSTHQGVPILSTTSEPYFAKRWWPCKQDLNDKIDSIDILVQTPKAFRAASNGLLVNETVVGEDKIYHWKHRYPIETYLIAISITNYAVYSDYVPFDNGDTVEVLNYVYPEDLEDAKEETQYIKEIMYLFDSLLGPYPFANEKYGHAQFEGGGGLEHQTMTFMDGFDFSLMAHELAHSWFGNKVTCGSWEDIWLNEGLATYLEGLAIETVVSQSDWHEAKGDYINYITSQPNGSVRVPNPENPNRIFDGRLSYLKGSFLINMLQWKLGDDNLFQGLQSYLNDPDLAYNYATTIDFQRHLEAQNGIELTEFFKDWFYNEGHPSYQIKWSNTEKGVKLILDQSTSHSSVDFFEMPVPIQVIGQGGQDSMIRVEHTFSGQEFKIDLPFEVKEVVFDPNFSLISANNTVEQIMTTSLESIALNKSIRIFPNPTFNEMNIHLSDEKLTLESIEIRTITGRLIQVINSPKNEFRINTSNWVTGMYFLKLYTNEGLVNRKVIKVE